MPRAGDLYPSVRDPEARNALVAPNLALVGFALDRLWSSAAVRRLGRDEAEQIGRVALMRAADLWDPARGMFSTYAVWAIKHAILNAAAHGARRARQFPVARVPGCEVLDLLASRLDPGLERLEGEEAAAALRAAMQHLPARLRLAIRLRYFEGGTLADCATPLGVTRERARQLIRGALMKLRRLLRVKYGMEV